MKITPETLLYVSRENFDYPGECISLAVSLYSREDSEPIALGEAVEYFPDIHPEDLHLWSLDIRKGPWLRQELLIKKAWKKTRGEE